jgi:hypothetical protein
VRAVPARSRLGCEAWNPEEHAAWSVVGNLLMEPYMPIWPGSRVKPLWNPISSAPLDHALEVQVADGFGCYALKFPCRLTKSGWVNAETNTALAVEPIAWRPRANRR